MPCRTDPMFDAPRDSNTVTTTKYMKLLAEANQMTKLLCAIEKRLDNELLYHVIEDIPGVREWYSKHAEEDRMRVHNTLKKKFPKLSDDKINKLIATGVFEEEEDE